MTDDDAIAIAKRVAAERGWRWEGRVKVSRKLLGGYEVRTNADMLGSNVRVELDRDGNVTTAAWLPR